jgi:hypothetical protein
VYELVFATHTSHTVCPKLCVNVPSEQLRHPAPVSKPSAVANVPGAHCEHARAPASSYSLHPLATSHTQAERSVLPTGASPWSKHCVQAVAASVSANVLAAQN